MSPLQDILDRRRSCRAYLADAVPRAHLESMLEAARVAPSACNRQPWRFVVATESGLRRRLCTEGILPGLSMGWMTQAPVLVVLGLVRSTVTHRLAPFFAGVDYPWMDVGIAGEHLVLRATELGLGTCWIGWIRPRRLGRIVGWPREVRAAAMITVGWPAAEPQGRERRRRPFDELVSWR